MPILREVDERPKLDPKLDPAIRQISEDNSPWIPPAKKSCLKSCFTEAGLLTLTEAAIIGLKLTLIPNLPEGTEEIGALFLYAAVRAYSVLRARSRKK